MAFNDADEYAHQNDRVKYENTLRFYDDALHSLLLSLKKLHLDKKTLVIITTDHGRGNGSRWTDHGPDIPESKQTFAFVVNGQLEKISEHGGVSYYNTLSIRPTVEKALAL
jgi:arylsulfatase A-like enzyme